MKSPITKLAAAAVFMGAMGLLIGVLLHTSRPAYALEQTLEAHHGLRFLHIKDFDFSTRQMERIGKCARRSMTVGVHRAFSL
jgi:hypothetical protein